MTKDLESAYPLKTEAGNRYRIVEYEGQTAHEYESGVIKDPATGYVLKPIINHANAKQLQERSVESRRQNKIAAAEAGIIAGVRASDIAKSLPGGVWDAWQAIIQAATGIALEGGPHAVHAMKFLRDEIDPVLAGVELTDTHGNKVKAGSVGELEDLLALQQRLREEQQRRTREQNNEGGGMVG